MSKIHIKVLRGAHIVDTIPALAAELKDCQLVLVEIVGTDAYVASAKAVFNNLSQSPEYVREYQKNLNTYLKEGGYMAHFAWAMRGQNKRFGFVDARVKAGEDAEAEVLKLLPMYGLDDALEAACDNPDQRYEIMNAFLAKRCKLLRSRDALVARQTGDIIKKNQALIQKQIDTHGRCTIGITQGYLHISANHIRKVLPGVDIKEVVYAPDQLKTFLADPLASMLFMLNKTGKDSASQRSIDYIIWHELVTTASLLSKKDDSKVLEAASEVLVKGATHPLLAMHVTTRKRLGPIDNYTPEQLEAKALHAIETLWPKIKASA